MICDDGATITSKQGYGLREAGWGGVLPPPDDTCNINCNDNNTCTSDIRKDCFCENTIIKNKPHPNQIVGNCQTEYCDGSRRDNDGDIDHGEDVAFDCKKPGCEVGRPTNVPDDGDISEEDAKCNLCDQGKIKLDESKNATDTRAGFKCGDGSLEQFCLECKDGRCQPDECKADRATHSVGSTGLDFVVNSVDRFVDLANNIPVLGISMKPFFDIEGARGKWLCMSQQQKAFRI